ncbi:MAG TPA: twin-arginine translocation signal domain-containing protein, partial [Gemmatimonadaceae bacterium]
MVRLARDLDRRDFIKVVTAGMALMPTLGMSGLTQVVGPRRSRVALVRTSDRKRGVSAALKLLDLKRIKGKKVVIKPNFNSADD